MPLKHIRYPVISLNTTERALVGKMKRLVPVASAKPVRKASSSFCMNEIAAAMFGNCTATRIVSVRCWCICSFGVYATSSARNRRKDRIYDSRKLKLRSRSAKRIHRKDLYTKPHSAHNARGRVVPRKRMASRCSMKPRLRNAVQRKQIDGRCQTRGEDIETHRLQEFASGHDGEA